jgi:hypothetical protein
MSGKFPVIRVTDGVTEHVTVVRNNNVSDKLLRALFQTDIVGLQCIDKRSNTVVFK